MAEVLEALIKARNEARAAIDQHVADIKKIDAALKQVAPSQQKFNQESNKGTESSRALSAAQAELSGAANNLAGQLGPVGGVLSALGPAGLVGAAAVAAVTAAVVAGAETLKEWTSNLLDTAGALTDQRDETGLSLKTLQEYGYVAAAAGVSQGELVSAVQRASRTIAEGSEEVERAAARLGLPFERLRAAGPDEQLKMITQALEGVTSASEKAAILKDFGFRDPAILRVMAQNIGGLRKEFNDLGLGLRDDVIERFDATGDELAKLDKAIESFQASVVQMVFGSADAGEAIHDLKVLVAEAGTAAREAAPLFGELYQLITGSSIQEQIEELRLFIAYARSAIVFIQSRGKKLELHLPTPTSRRQSPASNALSDVRGAPGLSDAALQRAKAASEALKTLQSTVAEGAISIARLLAEMAIAGDNSLTELGAAFARIDADTKSKLDALSKNIQDAVSKGVSPDSAKAAAAPLVAAIKEAATAAKVAASDALSTKLFGPGVEAIETQIKGIAEQWSILVGTMDPSASQFTAAADSLGKLKAQLTTQEWEAVREQARAFGVDIENLAKGIDTIRTRAQPILADMGNVFDFTGAADGAEKAKDAIAAAKKELQGQADIQRNITQELDRQLALEKLTPEEYEKLKAQLVDVKDATVDWSGVLNDVRNAFEVLGISADSTFGSILGGLSASLAAAQRAEQAIESFQKATTGKGRLQAGIGVGLAGLQAAGAAYQSGSALGGAASGAAFGFQVGGPIGAAIGGVAGGILGLFGGKARVRKELEELRKQLLDSVGGSMEELRKKAGQLGVDISRAFTTKSPAELKKLIEELNKAAEEQKKRWEGVQTAVGGLQLRISGFTQGLSRSLQLGKTFAELREEFDSGRLSIEQLTGATEDQQAAFDRLSRYAAATFGAYVRESGDVIGALRELDDSLGDLRLAQELFGFEGSKSINRLLGMRDVLNANKDVADSLQGLNQLMQGLGDAGGITRDLFQDFGSDAGALFNELIGNGTDANTAMALLQPTLQRLWEAQDRFGAITDETTAALLRQAEEQGLVGENMRSVNEQILTVLVAIGEVLGATIPGALRRMGDSAEREFGRFNNAAGNARLPVFGDGELGGSINGPGGVGTLDIPGFAVGGTVHRPTVAMVGERGTEHIMSTAQLNGMIDAAVARAVANAGAASGPVRLSGPVQLMVDGRQLSAHIQGRMESGRIAPTRGRMRTRR